VTAIGSDPVGGTLSQRIGAVLAIDPAAPALEFEGSWHTWGELQATVSAVAAHVPAGARVGILLRNRPASVALLLGVLRAGGCAVTIDPGRGAARVSEELATLDLPFVAGEHEDLRKLLPAPHRTTTLTVDGLGGAVDAVPSAAAPRPGDLRSGVAVQLLTSGTTGPPKRVDLTYRTLERVLAGAKHYEANRDTTVRLRPGVAVVNAPLVHLGGLFRVLQCVGDGRSFALLERFTVAAWADAVRRHRPATASLVPAALRMVLAADLDPADLSSLRSVVSGTAPLSPDDADAFCAKYGVPVLVSYAATEFGGGVAGWTLADHRQHWAAKRGSVGRAHPGCELRVVDPATGQVLPPDTDGVLEVKAVQLGPDRGWLRTTDLARLDADGFLWILGRADEVILRGGFKVRPDDVRSVLESHPAVHAATVVGRPDRRLGAVPVAAVELRADAGDVPVADLLSHAAAALARYELPVEIRVVDRLPRTPSAKVDLAAVRSLLAEPWTFGVAPLPQTVRAAARLRRVSGLLLALEEPEPRLESFLDSLAVAEQVLLERAPADRGPRVGDAADDDGRVYLDHSRDVGAFNPCFPEYRIAVEGDRASGTVNFPIVYEGPPGLVHGGFLALFFDAAIQHHHCDVGVAGKTSALALRYRRPTPVLTDLEFTLTRSVDGNRIRSRGLLLLDDVVLCEAELDAVKGDRDRLPAVSGRRGQP
jgi:acyl-CoA synthetase (AMP-forming)/AMP-acid ligase II